MDTTQTPDSPLRRMAIGFYESQQKARQAEESQTDQKDVDTLAKVARAHLANLLNVTEDRLKLEKTHIDGEEEEYWAEFAIEGLLFRFDMWDRPKVYLVEDCQTCGGLAHRGREIEDLADLGERLTAAKQFCRSECGIKEREAREQQAAAARPFSMQEAAKQFLAAGEDPSAHLYNISVMLYHLTRQLEALTDSVDSHRRL